MMLFGIMIAYALAKVKFKGRKRWIPLLCFKCFPHHDSFDSAVSGREKYGNL